MSFDAKPYDLGMAVLGFRAGDVIDCPVGLGIRRIRIEEVISQPEREGHFDP